MQETKLDKFNTFSLKNAGVGFSAFAIVYILASFIISLVANIFLTILFRSPDEAVEVLTSDLSNVILSALIQGIFLATAFIVAKQSKVDLLTATKFKTKPNYIDMLVCVAFSFGIVFTLLPVSNIFMGLLDLIGYEMTGGIIVDSVGEYITYIFLVCMLPAFVEETLFRGVILQGLRQKSNVFAIFISAFLFSIFHQNPSQTIHQFIVGVIWATLVIKTGSIWISVLLHFLNNFIAISYDFFVNISGGIDNVPVAVDYILLGVGILVFALCTTYFVIKYFKKKKVAIEQENETNEEIQIEKSVSGAEFEVVNGLSREKISGKKFFLYASFGIGICAVMWVLNLLIGMGVIALWK